MTAQSVAIGPITADPGRGGMFLGFRNSLRKELTQWLRGPGALIIAAKFIAATLVIAVTAIVLPVIVSVGIATIAYGGLPDLITVATFAGLYLLLPVFFIAVTIGFGTVIKSTAGVAGAAFAVVFVPQILGGLLPIVNELSPTSIGNWALAVAKGQEPSSLTLVGWLVSMVVIIVGAKLVFDRQEV